MSLLFIPFSSFILHSEVLENFKKVSCLHKVANHTRDCNGVTNKTY